MSTAVIRSQIDVIKKELKGKFFIINILFNVLICVKKKLFYVLTHIRFYEKGKLFLVGQYETVSVREKERKNLKMN